VTGHTETPKLHDWARTRVLFDNDAGYGIASLDGHRVSPEVMKGCAASWMAEHGDRTRLNRQVTNLDAVDAQRASAEVSRVARVNPGCLQAPFLAAYQRHSAAVARNARAEVCRFNGGTGEELRIMERPGRCYTFAEARLMLGVVDVLLGGDPVDCSNISDIGY